MPELDIRANNKPRSDVKGAETQTDFNLKEIDFLKNIHQELSKEIAVQKECVGVSSIETNEDKARDQLIVLTKGESKVFLTNFKS